MISAEHVTAQQKSLKSHLVEPLLTTLIRRHLLDASKLDLAVVLANKTPLKVSQSVRCFVRRISSFRHTCSPLSSTDSCKMFFSINISSWSVASMAARLKGIKLRDCLMRFSGSILRTPVSLHTSSPSFRFMEERCRHPTDGSSLS